MDVFVIFICKDIQFENQHLLGAFYLPAILTNVTFI